MNDPDELKEKLGKTNELLDKLDEMLAEGEITEAKYKQLSKKYRAEVEILKNQIAEGVLKQEFGIKTEEEEKAEKAEQEEERLRILREEEARLRRGKEEQEERAQRERKAQEDAERWDREAEKAKQEEERLRIQREEEARLRRGREEQEDRAQRERKAQEDAERKEREANKAKQDEEILWIQQEERKRIAKEREKLSVSVFEKKEGISQIKLLVVALVLGALVLLGYWALAPGATEAPETMKSTPTPTPAPDQKTFTNSIGMEFVLIPAGEFDMGSPPIIGVAFEGPVHRVKIANALYMGKYEVTQKQWREIMGDNPSNFKGDNLPVEIVSWNDVQEFIKKLNEREGTNKYRLPSEAEWEYAARAGTTTRYSFGDDESKLGEYAWYSGNSGNKTHEVGQKKPNPWGLYDMHGNVWEWVQDTYHASYNGAPTDGSAWEGEGPFRVFRGGSWYSKAVVCSSATRGLRGVPGSFSEDQGFRLLSDL